MKNYTWHRLNAGLLDGPGAGTPKSLTGFSATNPTHPGRWMPLAFASRFIFRLNLRLALFCACARRPGLCVEQSVAPSFILNDLGGILLGTLCRVICVPEVLGLCGATKVTRRKSWATGEPLSAFRNRPAHRMVVSLPPGRRSARTHPSTMREASRLGEGIEKVQVTFLLLRNRCALSIDRTRKTPPFTHRRMGHPSALTNSEWNWRSGIIPLRRGSSAREGKGAKGLATRRPAPCFSMWAISERWSHAHFS
jgi:hypothetical protein